MVLRLLLLLSSSSLLLITVVGNPSSKPYIPFHTNPFDQEVDHEVTYSTSAVVRTSTIHAHDRVPSNKCPLQFSLGVSKRLHSSGDGHGFGIHRPPTIYPVFPAHGPGRQVIYNTHYENLDLLSPAPLETPGGKAVKEVLMQAMGFPLLMEGSSFLSSPLLHDVNGDGRVDAIVADYDGGVHMVGLSGSPRYFQSIQIPRMFLRREWLHSKINETLKSGEKEVATTTAEEGKTTTPPSDPYHSYFEFYYGSDRKKEDVLRGVSANALDQDRDQVQALKERRKRRVTHVRDKNEALNLKNYRFADNHHNDDPDHAGSAVDDLELEQLEDWNNKLGRHVPDSYSEDYEEFDESGDSAEEARFHGHDEAETHRRLSQVLTVDSRHRRLQEVDEREQQRHDEEEERHREEEEEEERRRREQERHEEERQAEERRREEEDRRREQEEEDRRRRDEEARRRREEEDNRRREEDRRKEEDRRREEERRREDERREEDRRREQERQEEARREEQRREDARREEERRAEQRREDERREQTKREEEQREEQRRRAEAERQEQHRLDEEARREQEKRLERERHEQEERRREEEHRREREREEQRREEQRREEERHEERDSTQDEVEKEHNEAEHEEAHDRIFDSEEDFSGSGDVSEDFDYKDSLDFSGSADSPDHFDDLAMDDPDYGYRYDDVHRRGHDYDDIYGGYNADHEAYYDELHYIRIPPHVLCTPILAEIPKLYSQNGEKEDILIFAASYYLDEDEYEGFFSYKRFEATDHGDENEVKRGSYVANALLAYTLGDSPRWSGQNHLDLSTDYSAPENATLLGALPLLEDGTRMGAFALGSPTVADVDGDGNFDVLVGTSMGMVYSFDARNMYKRNHWPIQLKRPIESRILVEDVTGDTNLEIFVADIGGNLYCLTHEGRIGWHRSLPESIGAHERDLLGSSPMTLGDVDGDGNMDLVVVLLLQDRTVIWAVHANTGEDLQQNFPIELEAPTERPPVSLLHEQLPQPLLVDLHADQSYLDDYLRRHGTVWTQRKATEHEFPPHGGSAPGLHIVYPRHKNVYVIEAGSGCTQSIAIGDMVGSMVQVDDVHGTNRLDLVVSTEAGDTITLESASPYHPLNTWNNGELRGRMNAHAHGASASQGIFVHPMSRQYIDVFGVYLPMTFEIFDNRPNIMNEPDKRKYSVDVRDGSSSKRIVFRQEYDTPGVYTERLYIPYGPGYYTLHVVMQTSHGLIYEDVFHVGYNVNFMNGFGALLWLPLILASLTVVFFGARNPDWEDEDVDGDDGVRDPHSGRTLPS